MSAGSGCAGTSMASSAKSSRFSADLSPVDKALSSDRRASSRFSSGSVDWARTDSSISLRKPGEDRLKTADDVLKDRNAIAQCSIDVGLDRVLVVQIDDPDVRETLAKSIDASYALFNAHGVPGHVVVYERAAELEIQTLGRGVGAYQHLGPALLEAALDLVARDQRPTSIEPALRRLDRKNTSPFCPRSPTAHADNPLCR